MDRYNLIEQFYSPKERVLATILEKQAQKYGDKTLFRFGDTRWSYSEAEMIAQHWAKKIHNAGVSPGDRVAIFANNSPEFLQIFLGCAYFGAIAVPINTAIKDRQLAHVLNNSQPKLLVVEVKLRDSFNSLDSNVSIPDMVWEIDDERIICPNIDDAGVEIDVDLQILKSIEASDTAAILYTSGTTGPSKGVCCPQAQFFWWGIYSARALNIVEGDVLMTCLPLFHTNALNAFYQALLNGCEYVLLPKFSASRYWEMARDCNASVTYLLGAMAGMLLAQPHKPTDREHKLRIALGGGVPAQMHPMFFDRFGVHLLDGYGSTETNFIFAGKIPSDHPGTLGYLASVAQAVIVDEDRLPVEDGVAGELLLRPNKPNSFASGYFRMPDATLKSRQDLWFHTGDRVVREPEGYYRFIDRMKDAIRRRGENISSWEVEMEIQGHPQVKSCAVYAVPSPLGEDDVAAAIQPKTGEAIEPLELIQFLEKRLAYFSIPRYIRLEVELPMTENGKIKKVALREQGITQNMWDLEMSGYKIKRS